MGALAPWTGPSTLKKEIERLFDRFWDVEVPDFPALSAWSPRLDVSETKEAFTIKVEIPGIEPKDIELSLQGDVLMIKGEKKQEKEEKDEHYYRAERAYGSFARTVRLPAAVDASRVAATFKHGLLMVKLPKTPAAKGTAIPIKAE
jgi:HSP20 family protein